MEDIYRFCPEGVVRNGNVEVADSELHLGLMAANNNNNNNYLHNHMEQSEADVTGSDRHIKNQIATHPLYPNLLSAYIECQKVIINLQFTPSV